MEDQSNPRTAPFYQIPPRQLVSVEHPAVIKDVDKALDTLEGDRGISKASPYPYMQILNPPKADTSAYLKLRSEDPMSRPLQSTSSQANNILLKVTVPKQTGRKRKRGSDEPFVDSIPVAAVGPERRKARDVVRSLSDNVGKYHVEPVGLVHRTHVFRGMPDFVYSTTGSEFTNKFRDQILSYDLEKMKNFDISMSRGETSNVDVIPPPSFGLNDIPFNYFYRQNPSVKQSTDPTGKVTTVNIQQASKVLTYLLRYDDEVPTKPRDACPPIPTLEKPIQETIAFLQGLFEKQPIWTRRAIRNHIKNPEYLTALRYAVPYVGFIFRSGPWRDAIIKFGVDPRTSPNYRIYQTFMFKILPQEPAVARDGGGGRRHNLPRPSMEMMPEQHEINTHIFTATLPLPRDGRIWMARDIADPQLHSILFPGPDPDNPPPDFIRDTCEIVTDGWFGNGTVAKVKTIMRAKIQTLIEGRVPDDAEYENVANLPNHAPTVADVSRLFTFDPKKVSNKELLLATEIRSAIKWSPGWRGAEKRREEIDEGK
ncbi:Transcription factor, partial [Aspergillus sclerotialis]